MLSDEIIKIANKIQISKFPNFKPGDKVKIDIKIIKKMRFATNKPYFIMLNHIIKGSGGTPTIINVNNIKGEATITEHKQSTNKINVPFESIKIAKKIIKSRNPINLIDNNKIYIDKKDYDKIMKHDFKNGKNPMEFGPLMIVLKKKNPKGTMITIIPTKYWKDNPLSPKREDLILTIGDGK